MERTNESNKWVDTVTGSSLRFYISLLIEYVTFRAFLDKASEDDIKFIYIFK